MKKTSFMNHLAWTGLAFILFYHINGCAAHNKLAAWNAPGVTSIESKLEIEVPEYAFEE